MYRRALEALWVVVLLFSSTALLATEAADSWVDAGWNALEQQSSSTPQQQLDAAIRIWQQGVEYLAPQRMLLSPIGIYVLPKGALHGVKRLGIEFRGIVLKGLLHGKRSYFVLSVPPVGQVESFKAHFAQLLSGGQHSVLGWRAYDFQHGGVMVLWDSHREALSSPVLKVDVAKGEAMVAQGAEPVAKAVVRSSASHDPQATPAQVSLLLMEMAKRSLAKGDRSQAIRLLVKLLQNTPNHARARLMAGKLMILDGKYDAAWQVMRPLLKPDALDWKPWFWSGTAELMSGKLNDAASHFDEALARDGRVTAVWVQRALVAQERGRYEVAYQLLKVAETQTPKSEQVMLNMGFTLDALGKKKAASDYYRRYLVQTAGDANQWQARKMVIGRLGELN